MYFIQIYLTILMDCMYTYKLHRKNRFMIAGKGRIGTLLQVLSKSTIQFSGQ
jgi:hypothetical protein